MTNTHAQPLPIVTTPAVSAALTAPTITAVAYGWPDHLNHAQQTALDVVVDNLIMDALTNADAGRMYAARGYTELADRLVREFSGAIA